MPRNASNRTRPCQSCSDMFMFMVGEDSREYAPPRITCSDCGTRFHLNRRFGDRYSEICICDCGKDAFDVCKCVDCLERGAMERAAESRRRGERVDVVPPGRAKCDSCGYGGSLIDYDHETDLPRSERTHYCVVCD